MIHAEKAELDDQDAVVVSLTGSAGRPTLERMCELLGVSRSGYYAWVERLDRGPTAGAERNARLLTEIQDFHDASNGVYGAPRILADLREAGWDVSRKTVAKVMRENQIRGISPRPFTPVTTISDSSAHTIPDLVGRKFDQGALNLVWTSDITYLRTDEGWLYLCVVRDGHSRRVLGYAFADSLHTDVVEAALRRAVTFRHGPTRRVILHADQGCQYTSDQLAKAAKDLDVRLSVGRTGVCWDNAQQESYWSTLKTEFYDRYHFTTRAQATAAVSAWIENTYNRTRRHSVLGYIAPVAFEDRITTAAKKAA